MSDAAKPTSSNTILVSVLGGLELGLIATVVYLFSQLVGSKDTANNLSMKVLPITGTLGAIVLLHTILWYTYFNYNPLSMNLYLLFSTSMNTIISLFALSIALTIQNN